MVESELRLQLANRIMSTLSNHSVVRRTFLRGSLGAGGMPDRFSDIDIGVDVSGHDNGRFMLELPLIVGEHLGLVFCDFVPSLAPDAYVVNLYVKGAPIFWNVDIDCLASPHITTVQTVPVDETLHLLKLWVLTAKCLLRGEARANGDLARLAPRILGSEAANVNTSAEVMSFTLERLKQRLDGSHAAFLAQCASVCQEIAAQSDG